jgi:hypothetical protein
VSYFTLARNDAPLCICTQPEFVGRDIEFGGHEFDGDAMEASAGNLEKAFSTVS